MPDTSPSNTPLRRIAELDFLRGLMLLVMMSDHLIYFPLISLQPYTYNFTFQTFGFVSAAEGFVLLSGMIFGLVYGRKQIADGTGRFANLAVRRMGTIYIHYIGAYFIIALLFSWPLFAEAWPMNWESQEMIKEDPWGMFARAAVFAHLTGLLDILPMYFIFIALSIPAMMLLSAGKWKWLLAISIALWLFGQTRPQLHIEEQTGLHLAWFEFSAWQMVFAAGLALGYWRAVNPNFRPPITKTYIIIALAVAVPLFIYRHQFTLWQDEIPHGEWFDARNFGVVRIVNTIALAYLIYVLAVWRPHWFHLRFLTDIGGAALRVFSYHVVVCYALMPFRDELTEAPLAFRLFLWVALIASLYLPALVLRPKKLSPGTSPAPS